MVPFIQATAYALYSYDALRLFAPAGDPAYEVFFAKRAVVLEHYNQVAALAIPAVLVALACLIFRTAWMRAFCQWQWGVVRR